MQKPQKFGRYLLLDRISTGGMAEVFLAKSSGLQGFEKILAIKRILPSVSEDSDFTTMFIDEAKITASLAHVNIGQVFEFGQASNQYYIAMEYIPGKDLRAIQTHLAETDRVMDIPMALHVASRLCQALDYAHRQQSGAGTPLELVHRDVSPPNVILSYDGAVKLIDFGIAKAASRATRTRAGKLKGKFAYMSPEQVQGLAVDRRSDLFSLGILLHELLTRQRLFHGESQVATLNLVRRADVAPPSSVNPEVPLEVDRIVLRALARDRDLRYAWATELRADIERYLARTGIFFESNHLAEWMRREFAGEIEAERRMRERIHNLRDEDAEEARPPEEEPGAADSADALATAVAEEPTRTGGDPSRDDHGSASPSLTLVPPTSPRPSVATGAPLGRRPSAPLVPALPQLQASGPQVPRASTQFGGPPSGSRASDPGREIAIDSAERPLAQQLTQATDIADLADPRRPPTDPDRVLAAAAGTPHVRQTARPPEGGVAQVRRGEARPPGRPDGRPRRPSASVPRAPAATPSPQPRAVVRLPELDAAAHAAATAGAGLAPDEAPTITAGGRTAELAPDRLGPDADEDQPPTADGLPVTAVSHTTLPPPPIIYGPHEGRADDEVAHMATMLGEGGRPERIHSAGGEQPAGHSPDAGPPTGDVLHFGDTELEPADPEFIRVRHGGAIAPGPDRAATTAGGALEVHNRADRRISSIEARAVSVHGIESVQHTGGASAGPTARAPAPSAAATRESGTSQIEPAPARFTSVQIILLAGSATLLVAGLVVLLLFSFGGRAPSTEQEGADAEDGGSIVVTSNPPASCSVAVDARVKGMLQPGASLRLTGVTAGRHVVTVECLGFQLYSAPFVVRPAQASFVVAPLEKQR